MALTKEQLQGASELLSWGFTPREIESAASEGSSCPVVGCVFSYPEIGEKSCVQDSSGRTNRVCRKEAIKAIKPNGS